MDAPPTDGWEVEPAAGTAPAPHLTFAASGPTRRQRPFGSPVKSSTVKSPTAAGVFGEEAATGAVQANSAFSFKANPAAVTAIAALRFGTGAAPAKSAFSFGTGAAPAKSAFASAPKPKFGLGAAVSAMPTTSSFGTGTASPAMGGGGSAPAASVAPAAWSAFSFEAKPAEAPTPAVKSPAAAAKKESPSLFGGLLLPTPATAARATDAKSPVKPASGFGGGGFSRGCASGSFGAVASGSAGGGLSGKSATSPKSNAFASAGKPLFEVPAKPTFSFGPGAAPAKSAFIFGAKPDAAATPAVKSSAASGKKESPKESPAKPSLFATASATDAKSPDKPASLQFYKAKSGSSGFSGGGASGGFGAAFGAGSVPAKPPAVSFGVPATGFDCWGFALPPNPAPPVIPPVEALPPVPDTADMLEREKATVLLTWLTRVDEVKAESVNEVETLKRAVADTHSQALGAAEAARDKERTLADAEHTKAVEQAHQRQQQRLGSAQRACEVARAQAEEAADLPRHDAAISDVLTVHQEQIGRVRVRQQEAARLATFLEAGDAAPAPQGVGSECPICMDRRCDTAIAPCGHLFCAECAAAATTTCHTCREPVTLRLKLFGNLL